MYTISRDKLELAAIQAGLKANAVYEDYSGRGMYGDTCIGIVYGKLGELLVFISELFFIDETVTNWMDRAVRDDMGLQNIAYWPGVKVSD